MFAKSWIYRWFFLSLVEDAKAAGERPTAAFPSSHVGISTICMFLIAHARNYKLLAILAPLYFLLCCATVYIQAHYLVDAIAGVISAIFSLPSTLLFLKKNGKERTLKNIVY